MDSSVKTTTKEWGKIGHNKEIEKAEASLECCGFYDVLESFTTRCEFTTPCSQYILEDLMYRKLRFLALVSVSFVFQVYHGYSIFNILTSDSEQLLMDTDI